ncbi:LOW QUALITY PROTEIN: membrane-spanning 4-domains subfamily A member 15 [Ctenodactylus gundi]
MSSPPASDGVLAVIPPSGASSLCPPPAILPTSMSPPGAVQLEEPPPGAQAARAAQPPDLHPVDTFLTGQPKALGTVQILMGLIHLGFGSVLLLLLHHGHRTALFSEGGIPFWGGACMIHHRVPVGGAERSRTPCLLSRGDLGERESRLVRSTGTNILSATAAFGTAILLMDFAATSWDVGSSYLAVPTTFTILEFLVAAIATHFACQATRAPTTASGIFLPNALTTDVRIPSPAASPPPAYDKVAYVPKDASE